MVSVDRRLRRWMRLSLSPSGMQGIVAVASAVTFGWAGWEMLRQERAAEDQRERERLENQADRVVQTIERLLSEVDQQLDARLAAPHAALPTTSDGLVLVFDEQGSDLDPDALPTKVSRRASRNVELF